MANAKRQKIQKAIDNISSEKLGNEDLLSHDLAEKVGLLSDKSKITIRLDVRVIDEAKRESKELGVGYQKIINDRLLEIYALEEMSYLKQKESDEVIKQLINRIENLESKMQA